MNEKEQECLVSILPVNKAGFVRCSLELDQWQRIDCHHPTYVVGFGACAAGRNGWSLAEALLGPLRGQGRLIFGRMRVRLCYKMSFYDKCQYECSLDPLPPYDTPEYRTTMATASCSSDLPAQSGSWLFFSGVGHFNWIVRRVQSKHLIGSDKHSIVLLALEMDDH